MSVYTADDIKAVMSAPVEVGMAVAMVDLGIISTAIEIAAMAKEIANAAKKYPDNTVIQLAFSEESLKQFELEKPDVPAEDVESGAYIEQAIAKANSAISMLQAKADAAEIAEYKQFIYDCGEAVATAAGSGLFGTGAKVSAAEAQTLKQLKGALNL